jgi:adenosylmethionine-8-amino-7-oxononanoate aminotransferase
MSRLADLDKKYVWHPFTQMNDWAKSEPIVITKGSGTTLRDDHGREYLDANSSIWTNLHGHNHPKINRALQKQLQKIAHSSALGLSNEPATLLAEKLVDLARPKQRRPKQTNGRALTKVFFSDDGSTAMEVALKLAYEFTRRTGHSRKPRFLSLAGAYHGDTIGAVSLGHIDLFHRAYAGMLFKTDIASSPYCYRCPFNRARPERTDAREYRKCDWECLSELDQQFKRRKKRSEPYAAFVVEPLMQGAAGMIPQPKGWLGQASNITKAHGALLIADEVMTAFGRTGGSDSGEFFAYQAEGAQPDLIALAKGLTGGYLPMAATLTTSEIFDAFLGRYEELKTFFHGHSYTANQLGASAALASLDLLTNKMRRRARARLEGWMRQQLQPLWNFPQVGDIRQVGLIAGIELVKDWRSRTPYELREQAGIRVCNAMAKRGVLTRPIGNVIVLMPPYCTTEEQLACMVTAMRDSIAEL